MDILIADDQPLICSGVKSTLEATSFCTKVYETYSTQGVWNALSRTKIDLLIMELSLPGSGGVSLLQNLKVFYKDLPILILSSVPEKEYALRVLKNGVSGCLHKSSTPQELIEAVLYIRKNGRWISDRVKDVLLDNVYSSMDEDPRTDLSDREFQVIMMLAKGNTLKRISEDLNLSIKTVSTYKSRIMMKLRLENNNQLIKYTMERRLC